MILVVDPAAQAEMNEAALFYEESCEGLGQEFLDTVELAFKQITGSPLIWRKFKGRFRRYLISRFPYAIVYAVEATSVYVAAVAHLKRKPDYWLERVQQS